MGSSHHGVDCPAEGAGTGAGSGVVECSAGGFDGPCCPCLEVGEGMGGLLFLAVSGYGPLGGMVHDVEEPVSPGPCCPACILKVKKNRKVKKSIENYKKCLNTIKLESV